MLEPFRSNVILITVDALRNDFVSACSTRTEPSLTPNLDSFARGSIVFRQAIAHGSATPHTVRCLLTSRYNSRLGPAIAISDKGLKVTMTTLQGGTSLAEALSAAGYESAAFHSNPYLSAALNYNRGFHTFFDNSKHMSIDRLPWKFRIAYNKARRLLSEAYLDAEKLNRHAIRWLEQAPEPFFLWLHYMDPHGPFFGDHPLPVVNKIKGERLWHKATTEASSLSDAEFSDLLQGYRRDIKYWDECFGDFWWYLEHQGLADRSICAVTSDHGSELREHGDIGHGSKLYEELIRIPLLIRAPHSEPILVDEQVGAIDIAPTILDLLGITPPDSFLGLSLQPLLKGYDILRDYVISEVVPPSSETVQITSVRTADWKYIEDDLRGRRELYNLETDPEEQTDILDRAPQSVLAYCQSILENHRSQEQDQDAAADASDVWTDEVESRLRALGYLE